MASNVDSQLADALFRLALNALDEKPNASAVVSPFSIAMAVATVNVGANELTSREISDHAFAGIPKDQIGSWFRERLAGFNAKQSVWSRQESPLSIASAVYLQQTLHPIQRFTTDVLCNFDCKVKRVDFAGEPRMQKTAINAFVNAATKGHIPKLLSDTDISVTTQCVAVNAIYLKAQFDKKFNKSDTKEEPFHNEDGSIKQVQTMNGCKKGRFFETDRYAYAEFSFENQGFNFFFVVPKTGDLAALKQSFSSGNSSFSATNVEASDIPFIHMALPKFKTDAAYRLRDTLERFGITEMFQHGAFNGIAEEPLHVDDVIHKAIFELDEEGVTAAAATAMVFFGSCLNRDTENRYIRADRPFLYGVTFNGAPLFVGQFY